jgi:copper(I)-binding protein
MYAAKSAVLALPLFLALAGALFWGPAARAQGETQSQIGVENAWARPGLVQGAPAAVYLDIENGGEVDDRLTGVETPIAERAELHAHVMEGDVMKMRRLEAVDIPAGGKVAFAPGERHVMLFGLARSLEEGERFQLTLTFDKAGPVEVEVVVQSPSAGRHRGMGGRGRRY